MKTCGIYLLTCTANGTVYVGSSNMIEKRFWSHRSQLKRNKHGNSRLQSTYNKYGKESFKYEIIQQCDPNHLIAVENSYISYFMSIGQDKCMNMRAAGWSPAGCKVSDETRRRMSAAKKGVKFTDEAKANMSAAQKGKYVSPETRAKISAANKRNGISPETRAKMAESMRGKKRPIEAIEKTRKALTGRKLSDEQKEKIKEKRSHQVMKKHSDESKAKMSAIKRERDRIKKESQE